MSLLGGCNILSYESVSDCSMKTYLPAISSHYYHYNTFVGNYLNIGQFSHLLQGEYVEIIGKIAFNEAVYKP